MTTRLSVLLIFLTAIVSTLACSVDVASGAEQEPFSPRQDSLPVAPPKGAVVLFDGKGTNLYLGMSGGPINWPIEEGTLVSTPGNWRSNHLVSKLHFRDAEIHVEFMLPEKTSGNSGVYVHGNYELQIFNSFGSKTPRRGDAGAIYGFAKPLIGACRKPGEWQVYDIIWEAPRFDGGSLVTPAFVTVLLNGVVLHHRKELLGHTSHRVLTDYEPHDPVGPLMLQDHGDPVRFRNIRYRALKGYDEG